MMDTYGKPGKWPKKHSDLHRNIEDILSEIRYRIRYRIRYLSLCVTVTKRPIALREAFRDDGVNDPRGFLIRGARSIV